MTIGRGLLATAVAAVLAGGSAQAQTADSLLIVVNRAPRQANIYKASGKTLTLAKTLPVGEGVLETWVSPDGRRAYVANQKSNSITVLDLDALEVAATITHPDLVEPDGGVLTADSKTLYVVAMKRNSVFVIDAVANKVVKEIPVPVQVPRRVILSPDGKKLYVAGNKTPALAVVDLATGAVERQIKAGREPRGGLAFLGDGTTLLNASVEDDTLYTIDAATGETRLVIGVPISPQRLFIAPDGKGALVVSRMQDLVMFIPDTTEHDKNKWAPTGQHPWGAAVTKDFKTIYVANGKDQTISVIDVPTMQTIANIPAGPDPTALAVR
jgi:YVTN family beta-propeller protein